MTTNTKKSLFATILLVLLMSSLSLAATAYGFDPKYKGKYNQPDIPQSWCQLTQCGYNEQLSLNGKFGGTGSGCVQFSLAALIKRTGTKPSGYNVATLKADAKALTAAGKASPFGDGGGFVGGDAAKQGIENISNGALKWVDGVHVKGTTWVLFNAGTALTTKDVANNAELFKWVQSEYNKGNYIWLRLHSGYAGCGHSIMVDSVSKDGTINIVDTANATTVLNESKVNPICGAISFSSGKKSTETPTLTSGKAVSGEAPTISLGANGAKVKGAMSEQELVGMPPITEGMKLQMETIPLSYGETFASAKDLTHLEAQNMADWSTARQMAENDQRHQLLRTGLFMLGFIIALWGSLFLLGYTLDRAFPITGGNLTRVLSFNRYQPDFVGVSSVYSGKGRSKEFIAYPKALLIACILIGLGFLTASGLALNWILMALDWVSERL